MLNSKLTWMGCVWQQYCLPNETFFFLHFCCSMGTVLCLGGWSGSGKTAAQPSAFTAPSRPCERILSFELLFPLLHTVVSSYGPYVSRRHCSDIKVRRWSHNTWRGMQTFHTPRKVKWWRFWPEVLPPLIDQGWKTLAKEVSIIRLLWLRTSCGIFFHGKDSTFSLVPLQSYFIWP